MLSAALEKTLLDFASYASIVGRSTFAERIRETLFLPEPQRSEQLEILKTSIPEILTMNGDDSDFHEFVQKYNLSAEAMREFLNFLGPESGLRYFSGEDSDIYVTFSAYLKSILDEKFYDKLILYIQLVYGKKYWEEMQYKEISSTLFERFVRDLNLKNAKLAQYVSTKR